jgi:ribonuclease BN (tRNA processing enzyme)
MEVMFPGSSKTSQKFALDILELDTECTTRINGLDVTSYLVSHPSGSPSTSLRVNTDGKIITYTGDTEWVESLVSASKGADLLISEAYFFDKKIKNHLDYQTLMEHLKELQVKRVVLTHMGSNMLANLEAISCDYAEDGKAIEI